MLVRKSRYDAVIKESNELRESWRREADERIHDVNKLTRECRERDDEVKLLKENLNNVTAELTTERSARIDAEQALKSTRESYGDVEVRGIQVNHLTNGYLTHWFFGTGRDIVYSENLRYAEVYDGEGRFVAGVHNVVSYEIKYRQTEE